MQLLYSHPLVFFIPWQIPSEFGLPSRASKWILKSSLLKSPMSVLVDNEGIMPNLYPQIKDLSADTDIHRLREDMLRERFSAGTPSRLVEESSSQTPSSLK